MINEFRTFVGSSPTVFFRPHDSSIVPPRFRSAAGPVSGCAQLTPSARPAPATYGDEIRDSVTNLVADGAYI